MEGRRALKPLVRILLIATYPFLAISLFMIMGLSFGGAFVAEFTLENKTNQMISVTPVGTVGGQGDRHPLPVLRWKFPPIPSSQCGGFGLPPGETIQILYDMDDINFSEIVVNDAQGDRGQVIANPNPTANLYQPPAQSHFVIQNLQSLPPVPPAVSDAARRAQVRTNLPWFLLGLVVVPWVLFLLLRRLNKALEL